MTPALYPCPLPGGAAASELALAFDRDRSARVVIAPPLFDEANRMRRLTVEVMRRLDGAGIDSFLPDLPGCNESTQRLATIELEDWRMAIDAACQHFGATHVLGIRGGCLLVPPNGRGWFYGPVKGASLLKTLLRARVISGREAGRDEAEDDLLQQGLASGLDLAGWSLSAEMIRQLIEAEPQPRQAITPIDQAMLAGAPLWLRAEPGDDPAQADALAAIVVMGIKA